MEPRMDRTDHTDQDLARSIRNGDKDAFVALVRRYERPLSALVRDRLGTGEAVEDVLQETLMRAWLALRAQEPKNVRAWLYQVARNRCSDHLRSRQRRERIAEPEEFARTVNRLGIADARRRRSAEDVVDALEVVPEQERRALQAFYLDGMSIAEIAARHRCPPGTVKRRLSHGRDRVRKELGITKTRRGITMSGDKQRGGEAVVSRVSSGDRRSRGARGSRSPSTFASWHGGSSCRKSANGCAGQSTSRPATVRRRS